MLTLLRVTVVVLATFLLAGVRPLGAQPVCRGADLMQAIAKDTPAVHARLLDIVAKEPNGEALLWKVIGPRQQVSWLFGTIHLTDPRAHALSPATREALAAARTLALEIANIDDTAMQKAIAQNAALIGLPDGRRLDRLLPASDLPAFQAATKGLGIPAGDASALRPWFLTTMLSRPACEVKRNDAGLKPLDMALRDQVIARKGRVVGLESIADQLKAMASLPLDTELAWLRASLALYPRIEDITETLLQLYLQRRIAASWELSQALSGDLALPPAQLEQIKQALVVRRNRKMRDAALPLLDTGSAFIAVGALHLPGPDGLVQLLRAKGFVVTAAD